MGSFQPQLWKSAGKISRAATLEPCRKKHARLGPRPSPLSSPPLQEGDTPTHSWCHLSATTGHTHLTCAKQLLVSARIWAHCLAWPPYPSLDSIARVGDTRTLLVPVSHNGAHTKQLLIQSSVARSSACYGRVQNAARDEHGGPQTEGIAAAAVVRWPNPPRSNVPIQLTGARPDRSQMLAAARACRIGLVSPHRQRACVVSALSAQHWAHTWGTDHRLATTSSSRRPRSKREPHGDSADMSSSKRALDASAEDGRATKRVNAPGRPVLCPFMRLNRIAGVPESANVHTWSIQVRESSTVVLMREALFC